MSEIKFKLKDAERIVRSIKDKLGEEKFDYSLMEYRGSKVKVKIKCKLHGVFEKTPNMLLSEKGNCPKCGFISRCEKMTLPYEKFLERCLKKYQNIFSYNKDTYLNSATNMEVTCPVHGKFYITPERHLTYKYGCGKCGNEKSHINFKRKFTRDEFIKICKEIHGDYYDYSKCSYTGLSGKKNLLLVCPVHGDFYTTPAAHYYAKSGCNRCNDSIYVRKIKIMLKDNNINFEDEVRFRDCRSPKTNSMLVFDIWVPDYNTIIEYDGPQHYFEMEVFGGKKYLDKIQYNDKVKNDYCKSKNINMIRIPYKKESEIEVIINNLIKPKISL